MRAWLMLQRTSNWYKVSQLNFQSPIHNIDLSEAGHAAHFANIVQPSPLFAQERAPTSVAYAENQSMFLDSLVQRSKQAAMNGAALAFQCVFSC